VFIPDPNPPDHSPAAAGQAIRIVDNFSPYVVETEPLAALDSNLPVCTKGLEINMASGKVNTETIRNEISRLRYALPRILIDAVLFFNLGPPDNNIPFAFCPILLTTVDLLILNNDVGDDDIENAGTIHDIARQVPYLMMYSDFGPDFESVCARESERLKVLHKNDRMLSIEQKKARFYNNRMFLPYTITESMAAKERFYLDAFFGRFIICNKSHFSDLLNEIMKTTTLIMDTGRK